MGVQHNLNENQVIFMDVQDYPKFMDVQDYPKFMGVQDYLWVSRITKIYGCPGSSKIIPNLWVSGIGR